ncbi:MAG: hypothetical protein WCO52_06025 [bacterium]
MIEFPLDKRAHALGGWAIAATLSPTIGPLYALLAATVAGAAKEGVDSLGYGTPDWYDFIATVAGGVIGVLSLFALHAVSGVLNAQ